MPILRMKFYSQMKQSFLGLRESPCSERLGGNFGDHLILLHFLPSRVNGVTLYTISRRNIARTVKLLVRRNIWCMRVGTPTHVNLMAHEYSN